MSESTYCRVWRKARVVALSADEARSPLARRAYDLRHAAVSTWLNAAVHATQVAAWAGHSALLSCFRSTPSALSARRTLPNVGSMPSWASRETLARI
jgi:integrase